jgi:hypothetical protein
MNLTKSGDSFAAKSPIWKDKKLIINPLSS